MTPDPPPPDPRIVWPPQHQPGTAVVFASATLDMAASPETVWSLLIDCVAWPTWYRQCADISVSRGGRLLTYDSKFRFRTSRFAAEPEVTMFQPPRMLVWSARGLAGTGGSQARLIELSPSGCRVVTEEVRTGWLLYPLRDGLRAALLDRHREWLRSLKVAAEERQVHVGDR